MERLTKRNQDDTAYYYPYCCEASGCDGIGSSDKCDKCDFDYRICEKLGKYEDLEEQGKLIKLPCAVGDTVYTLNTLLSGKIVIGETTADAFMCALGTLEGRFGKTMFLTKEEAEAALAEMDKKEGTHAEEKEQPETE